MATLSTLSTLIELASKDSDEAAIRLGASLRACEEAQQKLDLLLQYRDDYALRHQSSLSAGISTTHLHNFHAFMHKLDHAITGQQKILDDAEQRAAHARSAWIVCEQKKMSFVTLASRTDKEAVRRELSRDQKQNDEHAARNVLNKPHPL